MGEANEQSNTKLVRVSSEQEKSRKNEVLKFIEFKQKKWNELLPQLIEKNYSLLSREHLIKYENGQESKVTTLAKDIPEESVGMSGSKWIAVKQFKILSGKEVLVNNKHKMDLTVGLAKDKSSLVVQITSPGDRPKSTNIYLGGKIEISESELKFKSSYKHRSESDGKAYEGSTSDIFSKN
jgi:hypothetical protein